MEFAMVERVRERERVVKVFSKPSRTKQADRDACDINNIMARYRANGVIDHVARYQGNYGDFIDPPDYMTACNKVLEADRMFMSLPSDIRARFENDPHKFLQFVGDEKNREELRKMGLLKAVEPKAATLDDVVAAVKANKAEPSS